MSFILDALKKSETDRQQRGSTEFANVPSSSVRREGPPAWLWVVAVLLLVNLIVLVGIMVRPDAKVVEAVAQPAIQPVRREAPAPIAEDFASQVASARENAPSREEPVEPEVKTPPPAVAGPTVTVAPQPVNTTSLPTIHELQANGMLELPEMHVDIHVYSENPEDRFVFINMAKFKEGAQLAEGPVVEEITPDGVVLSHNGTSFLLPRD
jgi:general secretion pathway protein B